MSKVTDCPKCRNPRESSRWPFCLASGTGEHEFTLKVECRRCGFSWLEPSADAEKVRQERGLEKKVSG